MKSVIMMMSLAIIYGVTDAKDYSDYPRWKDVCKFQTYDNKNPMAISYEYKGSMTDYECKELCAGDEKCGMCSWHKNNKGCRLYQHSVDMWTKAKLNYRILMGDDRSYITRSKTCKEETLHEECNQFKELKYDSGKIPRMSKLFTKVYEKSSRTSKYINEEGCKNLCSRFPECRSAGFFTKKRYSLAECILFSTVISQDKYETCGTKYSSCKVYERELCDATGPAVWVIVVSSFGALLVAGLITGVIYYYWRRRNLLYNNSSLPTSITKTGADKVKFIGGKQVEVKNSYVKIPSRQEVI